MFDDDDLTFLYQNEPSQGNLWERARAEYREVVLAPREGNLFGQIALTTWEARRLVCGSAGPYKCFCTRAKNHVGPHLAGPDDPNDFVSWIIVSKPHPRLGKTMEIQILEERG